MKLKLHLVLALLLCTIYSGFSQVTSAKETAARNWIKANEKELGIAPFHSFKLSFVRKGLAGETLRFQQMLNDVPVNQSEIVVNFNPSGELVYSSNSYDKTIENIATVPAVSKQAALNSSKEILKIDGGYEVAENNLVVAKVNNQTKLVYKVVTNPANGKGSWEVLVDAQSGAVLSTKDVAIYHHTDKEKEPKKPTKEIAGKTETAATAAFVTGTAMVYLSDPLSFAHVAYGTTGYVDGNDANTTQLAAARTAVTLPEIDLTAGVYLLKSSYAEIKDFEAPTTSLFTQATNNFSFTRDNNAFEAVNVFYHLDKSMRYINETLGINCRPALNSGVVHFDPSGLNGADNSHYIPSADRLAFGEGCVDDAEDADVIWHELGHGLHDWMTNGSASSLIGEGNGDYWAQSYSWSLNQWQPTDAAYHYMFSWDGHNTCWAGRITNYTGLYPADLTGAIHTDGQIWASALMRIWTSIGRTKTDKAFLEGLALTNSSTNQQNAAIAVRLAAINMNYPCADIAIMTDEFSAAGYTMPTLALTMQALPDLTVAAGAGNVHSLGNYVSQANPISPLCNATVTQSPLPGTVLAPGVHVITMTATLGGNSVVRTWNLTVTPNLGVNEFNSNDVVVYPNPASNQITVKGNFDANESVSIYNVLGQKVMQAKISSNEQTINVSELATGIYTIQFVSSKATHKFIKE